MSRFWRGFGTWVKASDYELAKGPANTPTHIVPARDAELEEYDPFAEYDEFWSKRSQKGEDPPYLSLIKGVKLEDPWDIVIWCEDNGLLGILPQRTLQATFWPHWVEETEPPQYMQRTLQQTPAGWITDANGYDWNDETPLPHPRSGDPFSSDELERIVQFEEWGMDLYGAPSMTTPGVWSTGFGLKGMRWEDPFWGYGRYFPRNDGVPFLTSVLLSGSSDVDHPYDAVGALNPFFANDIAWDSLAENLDGAELSGFLSTGIPAPLSNQDSRREALQQLEEELTPQEAEELHARLNRGTYPLVGESDTLGAPFWDQYGEPIAQFRLWAAYLEALYRAADHENQSLLWRNYADPILSTISPALSGSTSGPEGHLGWHVPSLFSAYVFMMIRDIAFAEGRRIDSCVMCGEPYATNDTRQLVCSAECGSRRTTQKYREKNKNE